MLIQTQLNGIELDSIEGGWREAVDEERLLFSSSFRSCQADGWATFPRQKLNFRHSDYDQVKMSHVNTENPPKFQAVTHSLI